MLSPVAGNVTAANSGIRAKQDHIDVLAVKVEHHTCTPLGKVTNSSR